MLVFGREGSGTFRRPRNLTSGKIWFRGGLSRVQWVCGFESDVRIIRLRIGLRWFEGFRKRG